MKIEMDGIEFDVTDEDALIRACDGRGKIAVAMLSLKERESELRRVVSGLTYGAFKLGAFVESIVQHPGAGVDGGVLVELRNFFGRIVGLNFTHKVNDTHGNQESANDSGSPGVGVGSEGTPGDTGPGQDAD